jgi:hypothetical protein
MPGQVLSYSASKQTADIRPLLKTHVETDDERVLAETLPDIFEVPVSFPRGGGYYMSFPIQVGDTGTLIFCERDISQWRRTGQVSDPGDVRTHGMGGAVFLPGLHSAEDALGDADGTVLSFGKDGGIQIKVTTTQMQVDGAADAAALASKVDALVTAFNGHTHSYLPGTGVATATATPLPTYTGGPSASQVLKVGS